MILRYPYRIDESGRTSQVASASQSLREMIELVLLTSPGERLMQPNFGAGLRSLVFAAPHDEMLHLSKHVISSALHQALSTWIEIHGVEVAVHEHTLQCTVSYTVRATLERQQHQISLPSS